MSRGKIFFAETRGFCAGVERAVNLVSEAAARGAKPVRVLHEIVHNETVVEHFRAQGVQFYEEPDDSWRGGTLILSAHGVGSELENRVSKLPLKLIDATCPLVKLVHAAAVELESEGRTILFIGRRGHRETEGVAGRLRSPMTILETAAEARAFVPEPGKRYAVLSQTTLSVDDCNEILGILKSKIPDLVIRSGICRATGDRQAAVKKLARLCGRIIVVGSENSSNSKRLAEVAVREGAKSILVPDSEHVPESFLEGDGNIGIAGGASAPEILLKQLAEMLVNQGWEIQCR